MKYYGEISRQANKVCWEFENVAPHVRIKMKRLFESIPKTQRNFSLPDTNESRLDIEWFLSRYPMKISNVDVEFLKQSNRAHKKHLEELEKIFIPSYKPHDIEFNKPLKPKKYQSVAAELIWNMKRVLIADEVGLGKTITALAALTKSECLPALIVVQPHLQHQWQSQIEKFTNLKCHLIKKTKIRDLPSADVYIIKYSNIASWTDILLEMGFKTFVMDEIQEVRRRESQKHQGCKAVSEVVEYCVGLSGTPIFNYGFEIWTLYNILKPGLLGPESDFRREWCIWNDKIENPVALGEFLRDSYTYIRRTKTDVGEELDPVNKIVHTVGYDHKAIDKMANEAKVLAIQVLEGSFVQRGQAARELSVMVRKATGISKAKDVANYVKMILENGEKVLLAGWHRDCYDIWKEELEQYNPVMYTGTESQASKERSKKAFVEGDSQIMLISLRSGVGLDGLQQSCSYVVFGELDWTPAVHEQVIGRLYRQGQKKPVTAVFLVSDSGSDPIVTDIIGIKKSQADGINDPKLLGTKQRSDDSIIKEFAKRYLSK